MELFKSIQCADTRYHSIEQYWWIHNDTVPCIWEANDISVPRKKIDKWILENFDVIAEFSSFTDPKKFMDVNEFFASPKELNPRFKGKILVRFRKDGEINKEDLYDIRFLWNNTDPNIDLCAKKHIEQASKLITYKANKSKLHMVIADDSGLDLRPFDINVPELDIELNYGKEWAEKHDYLIEVLSRETKKGIALLHGIPGSGKSMYIRYLISLLSKKRTLVYVPNQLINSITDPAFIPLMADYPNSILIIEDAEEAIKSRKQGGTTVDKLLNLSDGIISDFLGTQIICTFNNSLSDIDEALLRRGRLILKHEFGKLEAEQAQKLSNKLGFTTIIDKPMTLTEIYNQNDKFTEDKEDKTRIGFYKTK
jgi:hypothetical protein